MYRQTLTEEQLIINEIKTGKDGKINGDNLDIRVSTADMRLSSREKDFHFFATDWTPYRVEASSLPNDKPLCNIDEVNIHSVLLNENEKAKFKQDLKILIAQEMVDVFHCFKWMNLVLPKNIPHEYEEEINLNIPIGGDQLTRVRLEGAKMLLAGSHTRIERCENLSPVVIEFFHTLQDFLEKLCKKFLIINKSRDKGTLAHLRVIIQRSNVNGQVKSRFKQHEDFISTVGKAYLMEMVQEYFGIENVDSFPTKNTPPKNVEFFHEKRRQMVKGVKGKNKAAYVEKENQVKYLKELIRGLGRWKTEDNISRITKAGPVVKLVSDNFESLLDVKGYSTTHKVKSSEEDLKAIQKELTELQPFNKTSDRTLDAFK
ncbi:uncharacterized protein LOC126821449 [Patella vulgata]|uniref:uncharacterized protein LOC126821449 n=1 Tax=Patella vulgata TaxID=6465 RepID=UPI0024A8D6D7|nr:uncharacterized protein LOC126821449 [Patella vulgata]